MNKRNPAVQRMMLPLQHEWDHHKVDYEDLAIRLKNDKKIIVANRIYSKIFYHLGGNSSDKHPWEFLEEVCKVLKNLGYIRPAYKHKFEMLEIVID